jgi:hypothetical protein
MGVLIDRLALQRQIVARMRLIRAGLDPRVLALVRRSSEPVSADRAAVQQAVARYLAGRPDGGRLAREIIDALAPAGGRAPRRRP